MRDIPRSLPPFTPSLGRWEKVFDNLSLSSTNATSPAVYYPEAVGWMVYWVVGTMTAGTMYFVADAAHPAGGFVTMTGSYVNNSIVAAGDKCFELVGAAVQNGFRILPQGFRWRVLITGGDCTGCSVWVCPIFKR